jgi:hypothetical protein
MGYGCSVVCVVWDCPLATARDDQVSRPREYPHPEPDPMRGGVEADPPSARSFFFKDSFVPGEERKKIFDTNADRFSFTSVSDYGRNVIPTESSSRPRRK